MREILADLGLADLASALARFGVKIAARRIAPGDEDAFTSDPSDTALTRRRASGAARLVARALLHEVGVADAPLPRLASGAPHWPLGMIGSLAHDDIYAVAAVAKAGPLMGLGVDVEPAEPLPADVVDYVLQGDERRHAATPVGRLVFAAKEAVYKATHPLDGAPREYADIVIDLDAMAATLVDRRKLKLYAATSERLVAVALFGD